MCLFLSVEAALWAQTKTPALSGKIVSKDKEAVFATVYLKGTTYGCSTNEEGMYYLHAPTGKYTLVVSALGYDTEEKSVVLMGVRK